MTTQHDKAKRWRPRFSVRTLVIVVTLACCYFGSWTLLRERAVREVEEWGRTTYVRSLLDQGTYSYSATSHVPYVVALDEIEITFGYRDRHYYFWFFGYVAKLPLVGN